MKAPVGLSSDRTVLREQDGGASPRQVHLQQCSDAADEQTVHRGKPLQGHRNARQHPGHRGQGLV